MGVGRGVKFAKSTLALLRGDWEIYSEDLRSKGLLWNNEGDRADWNGPKKDGMVVVGEIYNKLSRQKFQSQVPDSIKGLWESTAPLNDEFFFMVGGDE